MGFKYFKCIWEDKRSKQIEKLNIIKNIMAILIVAMAIFIGRTIGYESGLITNDTSLYPMACYLWTGCFGLSSGCIYVILYPLLTFQNMHYRVPLRFISTIGVNWILFNCFISLITKGAMLQVLFRSGVDVTSLFISSVVLDKYIIGLYRNVSHFNK